MNQILRFWLLPAVLIVAFAAVGYVHGVWTDRFPQTTRTEVLERVQSIPMKIGDWEGKEGDADVEGDAKLNSARCLLRQYYNPKDGTSVSVLLSSGKPGPMVLQHLPTECYICSGFEIAEQPKLFRSGQTTPKDDFYVATFRKSREVVPLNVRVYWSWSSDGRWRTPSNPRMEFASVGTLYKLYVIRTMNDANEAFEDSPVHPFIEALTNSMRETFFAKEARK